MFVDAAKSLRRCFRSFDGHRAHPGIGGPAGCHGQQRESARGHQGQGLLLLDLLGGLRSSGPRRTLRPPSARRPRSPSPPSSCKPPCPLSTHPRGTGVRSEAQDRCRYPVGPAGAAVGSGLSSAAAATAKGVGSRRLPRPRERVSRRPPRPRAGVAAGAAAGAATKGLTIAVTGINAGSAAVSAVLGRLGKRSSCSPLRATPRSPPPSAPSPPSSPPPSPPLPLPSPPPAPNFPQP